MTKRVYLAGPMRGIAEFNFPAFFDSDAELRAKGWEVFNPARESNLHYGRDISKGNLTGDETIAAKEHGFSLRDALTLDIVWLCQNATAIALLPGWQASKGARAEYHVAMALGLEVIEL